jgi:CubicO group peptidase (beta-lactamase class C family)
VDRYWPGFAQAGKDGIIIRQILDHSSGLALFGRRVGPAQLDDARVMAEIVEAMEPVWCPGEAWGYHLATFGTLLSLVIGRADPKGRTLPRFSAEEVAAPLGLDIRFGLAADEDCAVPAAPGLPQIRDVLMRGPFGFQAQMLNPLSMLHRSLREIGLRLEDRSWLRHDLPSGNAVGSARSVACLYAALLDASSPLHLMPTVSSAIRFHTARRNSRPRHGRRQSLVSGIRAAQCRLPVQPLSGRFRYAWPGRLVRLRRSRSRHRLRLYARPPRHPAVRRHA